MTIPRETYDRKDRKTPDILMLDLTVQYRSLKKEIEKVLRDILESGHFILGKHVQALEQEVAGYHNVRYAVSLSSGTDALHLSLRSLGIQDGDEVITSPFTFIATAEAITYVGARPVFADIDERTFNIDPARIEEKINAKTRAIIPVHLFGHPAQMDAITDIAERYNLKVVEDSAQAFGAKYRGSPVGSIGDAGCFSFYPSKNLGGYGDGGIMVTNDAEVFESVKLLRNHGTTGPYKHSFIGYNSRLDEIQAAILRIKLHHIDAYNQRRRALAGIYTSILSSVNDCIQSPQEDQDTMHVYHQYTIRTSRRHVIQEALTGRSIPYVVYYPEPLHLQDAFGFLGYKKNDFPVSEAVSREVLSLPMYPELEPEKAEYVAETIVKAVKK